MSTGMPELGSKISLISKADIRYEGRLFTLDPQECTIALSNVRSFGTEDRETPYRVAPQNEVYDYILFRGSDIKDIRVVNNVGPLPNDPAIVQLSVPSSLASSAYQSQGFSHPVLGHMGPTLAQYPSTYGAMSSMGGLPNAVVPNMGLHHDHRSISKPPSELVLPIQIPEREQPSNKDQDLISGSRSATPILLTRRSPTMDQGVQVNQLGLTPIKKDGKEPQIRDGSSRALANQQFGTQQRDREHVVHRDQQTSVISQPQLSQQRAPQQQQRGWSNRGGVRRGRGRSSGSAGFGRQGQQQTVTQSAKSKTLKFDNDYDFEQANTEFEELRIQLAKTKIADSEPVIAGEGKVNGDADKKDDSGNETGMGEGEAEEEPEVYYDKAKSFFDNISCEAVERSKGRSQRTDWRTERKLNSETFGVASARRGGYRGRGYYGNRGMYRGNYRGNYRGQAGTNNRSNRGNNSAGTGVQQLTNVQTRPVAAQSK